ncbi:unnamed protein product [Lupinus luteus]|uniref:Uncharacterized protein n=1 Tax=Lupinus luteus TaxID=3873 RepID=A0AAV1WU50_LUPLU
MTRVEANPVTQHLDNQSAEDMVDIDDTVVEDSLVGIEHNDSVGAKDPLVGNELNETIEFQVVEEMNNPRAAHDMKLVGRLWVDAEHKLNNMKCTKIFFGDVCGDNDNGKDGDSRGDASVNVSNGGGQYDGGNEERGLHTVVTRGEEYNTKQGAN